MFVFSCFFESDGCDDEVSFFIVFRCVFEGGTVFCWQKGVLNETVSDEG